MMNGSHTSLAQKRTRLLLRMSSRSHHSSRQKNDLFSLHVGAAAMLVYSNVARAKAGEGAGAGAGAEAGLLYFTSLHFTASASAEQNSLSIYPRSQLEAPSLFSFHNSLFFFPARPPGSPRSSPPANAARRESVACTQTKHSILA